MRILELNNLNALEPLTCDVGFHECRHFIIPAHRLQFCFTAFFALAEFPNSDGSLPGHLVYYQTTRDA